MTMDTSGHSLPSPSCPDGKKREVCYYHDAGIANVDYGEEHYMVPRRVDMAHALVRSYGLLDHMKRLRTTPATAEEVIGGFHSPDYVHFLQRLTPESFHAGGEAMDTAKQAHNIGRALKDGDTCYDNPPIAGLWDYCQRYAGGSLAAARALGGGEADVAINWSGGMHHACRGSASGFCFVNDIVLAVRELLKRFRRVLYVDIDVHHGDGVETAFLDSNRVMTVSFHQRTDVVGRGFFPEQRGYVSHVGEGEGRYRALNVPLMAGVGDTRYCCEMFQPIMERVVAVFQPEAIVMQCGADSLSGDRLGELSLSVAGHAQCVRYMRSFNLPLLLLGGGGYTVNHVAACWCYETAVAIGKEIDDNIPVHCYDNYYSSQGYRLHYKVDKERKNESMDRYIELTKNAVMQNLSSLEAAPSVQFQDPPGGGGGTIDDATSLFYEQAPREDDDPMERLHRLCGERDERRFFTELGKRQELPKDTRENGGHRRQTSRSAPVKRHRHEKFHFQC